MRLVVVLEPASPDTMNRYIMSANQTTSRINVMENLGCSVKAYETSLCSL